MKKLTCTCGHATKASKNHNCICPKCGKEYYYVKPLGKWMYAQRVHELKEG